METHQCLNYATLWWCYDIALCCGRFTDQLLARQFGNLLEHPQKGMKLDSVGDEWEWSREQIDHWEWDLITIRTRHLIRRHKFKANCLSSSPHSLALLPFTRLYLPHSSFFLITSNVEEKCSLRCATTLIIDDDNKEASESIIIGVTFSQKWEGGPETLSALNWSQSSARKHQQKGEREKDRNTSKRHFISLLLLPPFFLPPLLLYFNFKYRERKSWAPSNN